jgi:metal-responsive CopG/Arc/MetJ family transcriptional regulator
MTTQVGRLTVSVPRDLIAVADAVAREKQISRSKVVAFCLRELAEKRLRAEMEEGYKSVAEEQRRLAEMSFELQRRVVPEWK